MLQVCRNDPALAVDCADEGNTCDELLFRNDEFCIQNDEFRMKLRAFCGENGLVDPSRLTQVQVFAFKNEEFCIEQ